MTTTTHRMITDLTARLLIGALLLGTMIVMGIAFASVDQPVSFSVHSLP